jgi:hypothetical protein
MSLQRVLQIQHFLENVRCYRSGDILIAEGNAPGILSADRSLQNIFFSVSHY